MSIIRLVTFLSVSFFLAVILVGVIFFALLTPRYSETDATVSISRGENLRDVSLLLKESKVIRSALAFQILVLVKKNEGNIVAGAYKFSEPESARKIAERLIKGDFRTDAQSVTFPEGVTVKEMSQILSNKIKGFDSEKFVKEATPLEGYLFPDTYFLYEDVIPEEVIDRLRLNFKEKIKNVKKSPRLSDHTLNEIVIMASILEEEAKTADARRIVSGILWSRVEKEIPLQVDAAFLYIDELEGRNTYSLTDKDLKIDSPYNTYINKGLPPTPITNPGLDALEAAANPIDSDYLFYLSDTQGNMYYAKSFDEHIKNKQFLNY